MPSPSPVPTLSKAARRIRRENIITKVLELSQRGYAKYQIQRELDITYNHVNSVLEIIRKRIKKDQSRRIEEWQWWISAKYEHLYRMAIEAFEASKLDSKGKPRPGNVAFLDAANNVLRDYRKMLGVDKQPEITVTKETTSFSWDSVTKGRPIESSAPQLEQSRVTTIDPIEARLQQLNELAKVKQSEQVTIDPRLTDGEFSNTSILGATDGEGLSAGDKLGAEDESFLQEDSVRRKFVIKRKPDVPEKELYREKYDNRIKFSALGEE